MLTSIAFWSPVRLIRLKIEDPRTNRFAPRPGHLGSAIERQWQSTAFCRTSPYLSETVPVAVIGESTPLMVQHIPERLVWHPRGGTPGLCVLVCTVPLFAWPASQFAAWIVICQRIPDGFLRGVRTVEDELDERTVTDTERDGIQGALGDSAFAI